MRINIKREVDHLNPLKQVLENESLTLDNMSFSEIVDSIDQQIDGVGTTVIETHAQILLVIVICKLIYIYIYKIITKNKKFYRLPV